MAHDIFKSDVDPHVDPLDATRFQYPTNPSIPQPTALATQASVIWTPLFLVLFFFLFVVGLSMGSIFTQGMLNGYYPAEFILLPYSALLFLSWIILAIKSCSIWSRLGAIFGCLWTLFTSLHFTLHLLPINPHATSITHLNAVTNSALLACYFSLSIVRTPFKRWDIWFFRLTPLISLISIAIIYYQLSADVGLWISLENRSTLLLLGLSLAVWWLRPGCWLTQPGPTFFFGITPLILLLLTLPHANNNGTDFFYSQVALLSILLANIRMIQAERHQ